MSDTLIPAGTTYAFVPSEADRLSPADVRDMWQESLEGMPWLMSYGENGGLTSYHPNADFIIRVIVSQPIPGENYAVVTAHAVPREIFDGPRAAADYIRAVRMGTHDL